LDQGEEVAVIFRIQECLQVAVNAAYRTAFQQFFAKHSELQVTANEDLLVSAVQSAGGAITAENLEAVVNDSTVRSRLTTTQAHKDQLAAEQAEEQHWTATADKGGSMIVDMTSYLLGPDGEPKGRTKWDKQIIQKRLDKETSDLLALSFDELSEKHAQWKYKKDLESMSVEEVRAIVQAADKQRRSAYTEFLPIPSTYSPPGKPEVHIPWTTELFKRLPVLENKRLFKLFGEAQLNAAVNGGN
jgi:hypothetical protein